MLNRIDLKFKELRTAKKKAFIAFITAGDPSLKITEELVLAFEKAGVDIVELGIPFSDPLADGPTIQASSQRALCHKSSLLKIFNCVVRIRKKSQIPIALMTYYNPVFYLGEDKFAMLAKKAGVDGVIVPDLPFEEAEVLVKAAKKNNLRTIFFLSPTTKKERIQKIIQRSSGFIYYVSLTGVTGTRRQLARDIFKNVRLAKRLTHKPLCVGFGISTPQHVRSIAKIADGVIVGSAIVKEIAKCAKSHSLVKKVARLVLNLSRVLREN